MSRASILRTLVIGTEDNLAAQLHRTLVESCRAITSQLSFARAEDGEIGELVRRVMPSLVFLEAEDRGWCLRAIPLIRHTAKTTPIIAFSRHIDTPGLLELMRAGVREWIAAPADEGPLNATIERIRAELQDLGAAGVAPSELVAFLPCKPGAGCSTMATHLASLCAETSGRPVALFDLDLSCGALQFITEAQGGISMLEAAQHAHRIDESLWNQLIARRDGIHLMHAGCLSPSVQMDPAQLQPLLSFAASQYPTVIADLPGSHDTLSIHVAEQSTQVYMVCTPDLASLHLARRQLQFLKELGVMDRVELVVNRATCHFGLSGRAIEEILEKSPAIYVPNNYLPLQKALKERSLMSADSPYCRALSELVPRILGLPASPAARPASPGDWIVRHRLSHPLQALRAAIHSFRPAATVPPSAGEEFGPAGFEQENPEGEQASSNAGATAREAVLPEAVATEVMASLAPPPAVTAEQGPRQGKRPASHRKGKQHR